MTTPFILLWTSAAFWYNIDIVVSVVIAFGLVPNDNFIYRRYVVWKYGRLSLFVIQLIKLDFFYAKIYYCKSAEVT